MLNEDSSKVTKVSIALVIAVCGFMSAAMYKVAELKFDPPQELQALAVHTNTRSEPIGKRGQILDREGRILAISTVGYKLFVDPSLVDDPEELAFDLSNVIDMSPAEIELKIRQRAHTKYVVIKNLLSREETAKVRALKLRPVGIQQRLVRTNPQGESCEKLIGLVGTEHSGLAGLEHTFEHDLSGEAGEFVRLKDSRNRTLWVSPEDYVPSKQGQDIQLSLDVVIQNIATTHLQDAILGCNAGGGRIVVVKPSTGEILAMADLLNPREGWSQQPTDPQREIDSRLGRNRCLTDPYEPGSTFKPFVWSVATELGLASPEEMLDTPSGTPYRTPFGRSIRDAHYYGPSSWEKVLIKSMNSGMAIVAQRLSHQQLQTAVDDFGFGKPTRIGLGGETRGIITSATKWSDYTQTSVAMGHEIAVTPLQMVQAFCAFARDGTVPQLKLSLHEPNDPMIVRKAISPETTELTRTILGKVMTDGTGRKAQSEFYELFGKSGTAQLPKQDSRGYFEDRYISSFIAGAPLQDPELVVLCVIDDPDRKIAHYGGTVAGPVVRNVMDDALKYLGVRPTKEIVAQASAP